MDDKAAKQKLERQKLVRYIPLIWKLPFDDRDSIKIGEFVDANRNLNRMLTEN